MCCVRDWFGADICGGVPVFVFGGETLSLGRKRNVVRLYFCFVCWGQQPRFFSFLG